MKRLVLAGGGHAHLAVLRDWARFPVGRNERWLVTPHRYAAYSGMLPGWMAGIYPTSELLIDLVPLAEAACARLVHAEAVGLEATKKLLRLSSGATLDFDVLSLATGGEIATSSLALLEDRVLPVRPISGLMSGWNRVLEAGEHGPVHLAVVGGGAAGVELALGAWAGLSAKSPHSRVSLVTPRDGFLADHSPRVRRLVAEELSERHITVHFADAVAQEEGLLLSNETVVPADFVIAATGSTAPAWLAQSGLRCTDGGFVAVGADMRSVSHEAIFAAGDIVERIDRDLARSGVHAVKAGPVLAANIRATLDGSTLETYQPRGKSLSILALGNRRAVLSWGRLSVRGRIAWWLKDWLDRKFVRANTRNNAISGYD